jgi:CRP-like cAMP-binding protein
MDFLRRQIEEIVTLTDAEFEVVQSFFVPREVSKKAHLICGGQIVTSEFLVVKGLLKSYNDDPMGREHIVQFAMEGWWISDYPAYVKQAPAEICVQALEDCVVLELKIDDKSRMCELVPKMTDFFGRKAFQGFVALQKRVLSLLKNSASEKYDLLLEQYPRLFQRVSKTLLAHYLGVSRETLSRLEKK